MATSRLEGLIKLGKVEAVEHGGSEPARGWLAQAEDDLPGVVLLLDAGRYRQAYTAAYDLYRQSAEALVLSEGLRITNQPGAHEATTAAAHAIDEDADDSPFRGPVAMAFRNTRHGAQYADASASVEIDERDARWAYETARLAVERVAAALGGP